MIKNIKLFYNDEEKTKKAAGIVKEKLIANKFKIVEENYDLAIAIGGDGAFLRMVRRTNFNSNIFYVGINTGTLGFIQEVTMDNLDDFIEALKRSKYRIEKVGIQESNIYCSEYQDKVYSLNEIIVRDVNLKIAKLTIKIDGDLLERFIGDGVLVCSSFGSTGHNISYDGAIMYNSMGALQLTPIAPLNSKVYRTIFNSIIIPEHKKISIEPDNENVLVTIDGENREYMGVVKIETGIGNKSIKCLRLSYYSFPNKVNEKLLGRGYN